MVRKFLELIRFSHTLFALPFALLGGVMALHVMETEALSGSLVKIWLGILLCMVFARSAAMSFNRWADQKFDALNPRTMNRHLPSGQLSSKAVLFFTGFCSLGFVASTLLFLPQNPVPLLFAVPVLVFLLMYSFAKRFTIASHFWLGTALMLAPIAAWVAVLPQFSFAPIFLGLAVLFWVTGFDIIYATQDHDFDRNSGLKSIPARFGVEKSLFISAGCHFVTVLFLLALPQVYPAFGKVFYYGIGVVAALLVGEYVIATRTRSKDDSARLVGINIAFFYLNAVISVLILCVGCWELYF
ncbi:MAG: 4-hydroxybenzoate octaprenyltransferase [Thermoguttaceae bacterium]